MLSYVEWLQILQLPIEQAARITVLTGNIVALNHLKPLLQR